MLTYEFTSEAEDTIQCVLPDGSIYCIPCADDNPEYRKVIASGQKISPYVPPEPAPEKTTQEKVDQLLSDYGLSREEMQAALAVKTE